MKQIRKVMLLLVMLAVIASPLSPLADARVSISFLPSGDLEFTVVESSRASSGLYKVVGWVASKKAGCADPRLEVWDQQCNPKLSGGPTAEFRTFIAGEPVTIRGRSYTTYTVPKVEVEKLLQKDGFSDVREGQNLYFSPIFKLYKKDAAGALSPLGGEFKTLRDVIGAQEWKVKSGFRQYYDIPVKFASKNPLYVVYKDEDGGILTPPKLIGEYTAGAYPGPIVLDRVLNRNGTTLELTGSWIERIGDAEPRSRRFEVDGSITTRNVTVAYGGTTIVAIYDGDGARVDAKFVDESGKKLIDDVHVGNYRTGAKSTYKYEEKVVVGEHVYRLVKSYQTNRSDKNRRFLEQTSGKGMLQRLVDVEQGGHFFWGVYRKTDDPAVAVDLSLHIPHHVGSTQTNVTGTLEVLANTNTELKEYEIIGLSNAYYVNEKQKKGTLSGKTGNLSIAINVPVNSATKTITAKIKVYNKEGEFAEDSINETIVKNASGGSSDMDTSHKTVLESVNRGSEEFDVSKGIPSSESLYANVTNAKEYLNEFQYKSVNGKKTYSITVRKSYTPFWYETVNVWGTCEEKDSKGKVTREYSCIVDTDEERRTGSAQVYSETYAIERPFNYYVTDKFALYGIDHARINNASISGGGVNINPSGYSPPTRDVWHGSSESDHVKDAKIISSIVTLPSEEYYRGSKSESSFYSGFESTAEAQVGNVYVRNDRIIVNSTTVMSDAWTEEEAPAPGEVPKAKIINNNVLYVPSIQIPAATKNAVYPSTGNLKYRLLEGLFSPPAKVDVTLGPNAVTVHTPVVNDSVIPDSNRPFDQRMDTYMNVTKPILVLDRPFTVDFDETAPHLSIKGYGNRDYSAYIDKKRIKFPFDVFEGTGTTFYPALTWIDMPVGTPSMTFKLPTWVSEGDYEVTTQAWAINRQPGETCQADLNGNRSIQCAERKIEVSVTGRIHSFKINDIGDFRFENVFRQSAGSLAHTGVAYVSGNKDANGDLIPGIGSNLVLPVRKGSHPTQKNTVPHNGYPIQYTVKSIGDYWDKGDGIRVEPTFYFVSKDGKQRQVVDLYYDTAGDKDKMIKVGSNEDKQLYTRSYVLPAPERNIVEAELRFAAEFEHNEIMTPAQRLQTPWTAFYKQYKVRETAIAKGYDINILSYKARTLVGPTVLPTGIDATVARRSVQKWYGEYNVPIAPYILPKGTKINDLLEKYKGVLTGRESEYLKGGYILVNFQIYMVRGNDENRMLGYKTTNTDMWKIEGQTTNSGGFAFESGDIILFESDFSARNDFESAGR
ncbi:DUF5704 domain-containing protein [Paenibacillus sp. L3-i20]|uniref:DUF5704 domain-containing protein n=1 Tax=Paenibacillus sp. L3-i20 TaxID=2905833 RepID=UPI001EDEDEE4|nr:DUF5704 domain-containing protein [Paenibacillus sp. L3-i20]GKU78137.1 hypothetical protein L3i20_v225340 [Paenibacillus sp. L3-i20]